jgi:enoyl-[acyl-carrier protein] reductase/trans-2-enoyl-CoA reductase (NAD+)
VSKSVLKPKRKPYTNKSIDFATNEVIQVSLEAATDDEIRQTVDVMGGEDWHMWIDA